MGDFVLIMLLWGLTVFDYAVRIAAGLALASWLGVI